MGRHGYQEDLEFEDQWSFIRWRGSVASAIRGKRGQKFLKEMLAALDAMPEKRLVAQYLVTERGEVCALGALGRARGFPIGDMNPEDHDQLAEMFNVASCLIQEVEFENDEYPVFPKENTGEVRYEHMKKWCESNIKK